MDFVLRVMQNYFATWEKRSALQCRMPGQAEGWPVISKGQGSQGKGCQNAFSLREAIPVSGLQETQDVETRGWVGLGPPTSEREGLGKMPCHAV